eukprot:tig00020556_g11060.t1
MAWPRYSEPRVLAGVDCWSVLQIEKKHWQPASDFRFNDNWFTEDDFTVYTHKDHWGGIIPYTKHYTYNPHQLVDAFWHRPYEDPDKPDSKKWKGKPVLRMGDEVSEHAKLSMKDCIKACAAQKAVPACLVGYDAPQAKAGMKATQDKKTGFFGKMLKFLGLKELDDGTLVVAVEEGYEEEEEAVAGAGAETAEAAEAEAAEAEGAALGEGAEGAELPCEEAAAVVQLGLAGDEELEEAVAETEASCAAPWEAAPDA